MKNKYNIALLFGLCHGCNDFIAGYLLSGLSTKSSNWEFNSIIFLVYSLLAFGGQLPAGLLLDFYKKIKVFSVLAVVLMIAAVGFSYIHIVAAIVLSGVASAFIHVCGGAACYLSDTKSTTLPGIFTSPGVLGLIAGGVVGATQFSFFYVLIIMLAIALLYLIRIELPAYINAKNTSEERLLDTHDFFMLILLLAIAFRSLYWNILHMMYYNNTRWLIGIAISAFSGKLLGGYFTDKIDWKKFVPVTMIGAVVLLNIGKSSFPLFCIGVALLQSAVPLTLWLMQNYMQGNPALATGLALGVAIALAGLPTYLPVFHETHHEQLIWWSVIVLWLLSNIWLLRKIKFPKSMT